MAGVSEEVGASQSSKSSYRRKTSIRCNCPWSVQLEVVQLPPEYQDRLLAFV